MALSLLIAEEMPFPCYLLERPFPFVKHKALDLLGTLTHLRVFFVDLDELDCEVMLGQHCHQTLEVSLAVDVSAVEFSLVEIVLDFLKVHQPHFCLVVFDLVPAQVIDLEITVLEGQNTAIQIFLLEFTRCLEYLLLEGRHFLLENVLDDPNLTLLHVDKSDNHQHSGYEERVE